MRKRALLAATGFLVAILLSAVNAQDIPDWQPDPDRAGTISAGYQSLHRIIGNGTDGRGWAQWGQDAQHTGTVNVAGQSLPGGCTLGTAPGVDPATNELPAGIVHDSSSK